MSRRKSAPAPACRPSWSPATLRHSWRSRASALLRRAGRGSVDQRAVVPFGLAELRGARGVGAVHARAQIAVVAELQHRQVGGACRVNFQPAVWLAVLLGGARVRPAWHHPASRRDRPRSRSIRHGHWWHRAGSRKTWRPARTALPGFP
jgi:hypothetical protein